MLIHYSGQNYWLWPASTIRLGLRIHNPLLSYTYTHCFGKIIDVLAHREGVQCLLSGWWRRMSSKCVTVESSIKRFGLRLRWAICSVQCTQARELLRWREGFLTHFFPCHVIGLMLIFGKSFRVRGSLCPHGICVLVWELNTSTHFLCANFFVYKFAICMRILKETNIKLN